MALLSRNGVDMRPVKEFIRNNSKAKHIEFLLNVKKQAERKLEDLKGGLNEKSRRSDSKAVEKWLVQRSKLVCCTLAISGLEKLEPLQSKVDYLIIDEACQAIEPATMIPMALDPMRTILVGD